MTEPAENEPAEWHTFEAWSDVAGARFSVDGIEQWAWPVFEEL